jgi:8-oxo-dGTP pyrophosphatase MutT (NUDIX family)
MIEFEILAHGFFRPEQLVISYDPTLRLSVTEETQAWMDEVWQQKLTWARETGTRLFDAPLFRFISASMEPDGTLRLVVSDTSYKEYVTTRMPEFARKHGRDELGNALSVCSVVETSDNYILLDRRQGVDVYVGRYHVIGGFFERNLDMRGGTSPDPFAAMRREIREETGIQADDISESYCLGVVYDLNMPHGEVCFLHRLHIPLSVVQTREPEDDEITQLVPLQVTAESLRDFILEHHGNISATGEPNLLMYGGWKFGRRWFDEVLRQIQ